MKNRLLEMGIDEESCNKILEMFNKSIEEKDREIADIKLNYEIENVLNSYSVKTNKAVKALLNMEEIKFVVDAVKDIDCMNPLNAEKIFEGDKTGYPPCTSQACVEILDHYGVELKGKNVAVVGRSMVVGKPLAMLLLDKNATVTICHSRTADLPAVCRQNDVVIAAVGRAEMVTGDFISEGAVVIDVGINVNAEGKLCGDVKFDECVEKASMITPVPAGVGSVTTSVLAKHVVKACKQLNGIK